MERAAWGKKKKSKKDWAFVNGPSAWELGARKKKVGANTN